MHLLFEIFLLKKNYQIRKYENGRCIQQKGKKVKKIIKKMPAIHLLI